MGDDSTKQKLGAKRPVPVGSFMMRRVFKQENRYYCGICRHFHDNAEDANRCLENCWKLVLKSAPWTPVKRIGKLAYACIYCQRTYATPQLATTCAEDCASHMTITSLDGRDLSPVRTKHVFIQQKIKHTVTFPFKIGGQEFHANEPQIEAENFTPVAAPSADLSNQSNQAQPTPEPEAKAPAKPAAGRSPLDGSKKFEREGAKYVCLVCHKKYFERIEAEKCFDSHADGSA